MLSGALKENVNEEAETKEEFTKRKMDERKKTFHEGKLQGQFVEKSRNIDKQWGFEERGHVICSSGAGTKNQFNQIKTNNRDCYVRSWGINSTKEDTRVVQEAWTGKLRQVV